jgi:hypothetical protein
MSGNLGGELLELVPIVGRGIEERWHGAAPARGDAHGALGLEAPSSVDSKRERDRLALSGGTISHRDFRLTGQHRDTSADDRQLQGRRADRRRRPRIVVVTKRVRLENIRAFLEPERQLGDVRRARRSSRHAPVLTTRSAPAIYTPCA